MSSSASISLVLLVEVTSLDHFVETFLQNTPDNTAIRFPECPRCKRKIRRCTRYMPVINQVNNLIANIKKKILGNQSEHEMKQQRKELIDEYQKLENKLQEISLIKIKTFFEQLYNTESIFSNDIFILMKNIIFFLNEIEKLLVNGRKKVPVVIFENLVSGIIETLI